MANSDRIERFSKVRSLLDYPYPQKPAPHQILEAMLMAEQALILRLTNTRQPWHLVSYDLATVADQESYTITQPISAYQNSGKVHYVIRATGNSDAPYLSIPYDDFSDRDFGNMPAAGEVNASLSVPEKISFYRANVQDQTIKAVISPVPQEVLNYTIWFFVGNLDRSHALIASGGPILELSDYLDLNAARNVLDLCEWRDDPQYNDMKYKKRMAAISGQISMLEPVVDEYIKSMNGPKTFDMDYWND